MQPLRILLVKPYQRSQGNLCTPPLGLLYLASTLRARLGARVDVRVVDLNLGQRTPELIDRELSDFRPQVVGISALNWVAEAAAQIARRVRQWCPETLLVIGGPIAHKNARRLAAVDLFEWIFDGEADWAFPLAIERWLAGGAGLEEIVGLTWRRGGQYVNNQGVGTPLVGVVDDLDAIPFPAWDLVDFDAYAREYNFNLMLKGRRYAPLFTSRGCPFLCTYCHDIFGKRFRERSPANVLAEARLLRERYGVDEFQIVDDIFNLNSGRMKEICRGLAPLGNHLCFPNGLRFDVLDEEGVEALVQAGTYAACVAVETVTPRLQELVKKRLHLDATLRAIRWMAERNVLVRGFFMLGFPGETPEEIQATVDFAVKSELSQASFFTVVPQPGTPLYDLARQEAPEVIEDQFFQEYNGPRVWYREAYGVDLDRIRRWALIRFYLLSPKRWKMIARQVGWRDILADFAKYLMIVCRLHPDREPEALPEQLLPLAQRFTEELPVTTSAEELNRVRQAGVPRATRVPAADGPLRSLPVIDVAELAHVGSGRDAGSAQGARG